MTDESICLDAPQQGDSKGEVKGVVRVMGCSGYPRQKWDYNKINHKLKHIPSGQCLTPSPSSSNDDLGLRLLPCSDDSSQKWMLESVPWK